MWLVSTSGEEHMAICMLLHLNADTQGRQELWRGRT